MVPKAVSLKVWDFLPSPVAAMNLVYSIAQSIGMTGGGGEVSALGRLGVAERGMGVETPEPPEVNLDGAKGAESSSSHSSLTGGMKAGALGLLPGREEDMVKAG
jgi:hypothetical protein